MFDLVQTVAKKQVEMVKEMVAKSEVMFKGFDGKKEPAAYADDVRVAMEKAMADVKETVDLGIKAQNEVVDLLVKRATANFEDMKTVAA
jgi:phasin family protein